MTDIDFDELDRAVNSLANPGSPEEPAGAAVFAAPNATPLAARRSSGRFMDVVHPSSDMRTAVPPRLTSSLSPVDSAVQTTTDMPDPLDFTPGAQESTPLSALEESDADIANIADNSNSSLSEVASDPLDTPFIVDAKVEKRPLGAFSAPSGNDAVERLIVPEEPLPEDDAVIGAPEPSFEPAQDSPDDHPIGNDTPLPAELQGDVLSIEAAEETAAVVEEPVVAEAPVGPTSITQQYSEQVSTGDQPTGSIFNSEAYKKPLAHPKKKQSGWLMVIWILLLLVIGAGAGAGVYFYVLPLL